MKKGFSLAEIILVIIIMGVIVSLSVSTLSKTGTNTVRLSFKSAFKIVESIVSEKTADFDLFPSGTLDNSISGGNYKLCQAFWDSLNTLTVSGDVGCASGASSVVTGSPNFVTTNGMRWYGFEDTFSGLPAKITVKVDVNGSGKGPNTDDTGNPDRDILRVYIYKSGKVETPSGGVEESYIKD